MSEAYLSLSDNEIERTARLVHYAQKSRENLEEIYKQPIDFGVITIEPVVPKSDMVINTDIYYLTLLGGLKPKDVPDGIEQYLPSAWEGHISKQKKAFPVYVLLERVIDLLENEDDLEEILETFDKFESQFADFVGEDMKKFRKAFSNARKLIADKEYREAFSIVDDEIYDPFVKEYMNTLKSEFKDFTDKLKKNQKKMFDMNVSTQEKALKRINKKGHTYFSEFVYGFTRNLKLGCLGGLNILDNLEKYLKDNGLNRKNTVFCVMAKSGSVANEAFAHFLGFSTITLDAHPNKPAEPVNYSYPVPLTLMTNHTELKDSEKASEIVRKALEGKNVVVIDNVVDSGNTSNFAANYLWEHGAKELFFVAWDIRRPEIVTSRGNKKLTKILDHEARSAVDPVIKEIAVALEKGYFVDLHKLQ